MIAPREALAKLLEEHGRARASAGWNGSPDPSNWRNLAQTCICNERICDLASAAEIRRALRLHQADVILASNVLEA